MELIEPTLYHLVSFDIASFINIHSVFYFIGLPQDNGLEPECIEEDVEHITTQSGLQSGKGATRRRLRIGWPRYRGDPPWRRPSPCRQQPRSPQ